MVFAGFLRTSRFIKLIVNADKISNLSLFGQLVRIRHNRLVCCFMENKIDNKIRARYRLGLGNNAQYCILGKFLKKHSSIC